MQKDIGAVMGLYPTPVTVCGTVLADGRVNWLTIAHVGVVEHGHLLVSIDAAHELSDAAIAANKTVSVSLVSRDMMDAADWCGIAKAAKRDKSGAFAHRFDDVEGAPIIEEAPLCMTCRVVDELFVGNFHNYVLKPVHTYVAEEFLTEKGKIDFAKMSPLLFEFSSGQYLGCGDVIGQCWREGRDFEPEAGESVVVVPVDGTEVATRFGTAERFAVYTVRDSAVAEVAHKDVIGFGRDERVELALASRAQAVICERMCAGAAKELEAAGCAVYSTVTGDADGAVAEYAAGTLTRIPITGGGNCENASDNGNGDE